MGPCASVAKASVRMSGRLRKGRYSAFNEVMTWGGFGGHWSTLPRV
ncbi:unnamed protein product [Linum tenue]|uniref:Uncharacterized protein n=1 Tax=Linum tenue TaxID=586396 RepID=A0AAV0I9Q8_9ROSI|nr:unnamed protein product [Linum tenue]